MSLNLKSLIERVKVWAQKDAIKNIWQDKRGLSIPVMTENTTKYNLSCCSLFQLQINSDAPIHEIIYQVERAKEESKLRWEPKTRCSGERACFTICTPAEQELKNQLTSLGFVKSYTFPRRNGYPGGVLEMYCLSW